MAHKTVNFNALIHKGSIEHKSRIKKKIQKIHTLRNQYFCILKLFNCVNPNIIKCMKSTLR